MSGRSSSRGRRRAPRSRPPSRRRPPTRRSRARAPTVEVLKVGDAHYVKGDTDVLGQPGRRGRCGKAFAGRYVEDHGGPGGVVQDVPVDRGLLRRHAPARRHRHQGRRHGCRRAACDRPRRLRRRQPAVHRRRRRRPAARGRQAGHRRRHASRSRAGATRCPSRPRRPATSSTSRPRAVASRLRRATVLLAGGLLVAAPRWRRAAAPRAVFRPARPARPARRPPAGPTASRHCRPTRCSPRARRRPRPRPGYTSPARTTAPPSTSTSGTARPPGRSSETGVPARLLAVGGHTYLQGDASFWNDALGTDVGDKLAGHWVLADKVAGDPRSRRSRTSAGSSTWSCRRRDR